MRSLIVPSALVLAATTWAQAGIVNIDDWSAAEFQSVDGYYLNAVFNHDASGDQISFTSQNSTYFPVWSATPNREAYIFTAAASEVITNVSFRLLYNGSNDFKAVIYDLSPSATLSGTTPIIWSGSSNDANFSIDILGSQNLTRIGFGFDTNTTDYALYPGWTVAFKAVSVTTEAVPEAASLSILVAAGGLLLSRRRK